MAITKTGPTLSVGATTVIFFTWPRREQPESLGALTNAYWAIAKEINAVAAPVGVVWNDVLKEKPLLPLYHRDGSHPNPIGSYLAACVLYSVFFDESPVDLPPTLYTVTREGAHIKAGELSKTDAAVIQRAAWNGVQKTVQPKP